MNNNYKPQRDYSDATIPQAFPIIYKVLGFTAEAGWEFRESTKKEDTKHCTDLVMFNEKMGISSAEGAKIGYRTRLEKYLIQFPNEVTLRFAEFDKIMKGEGELNFYGFLVSGVIVRWIILNLPNLANAHKIDVVTGIHEPTGGIRRSKEKNTGKGDTMFWAYDMISVLNHDNNILTQKEDKIIVNCSDGFFEDIIIMKDPEKPYMKRFLDKAMPKVKLKNMIDRIDKY